ncbi:hypothetical protein Q760_16310 [Cellulomonas cellasea DSM 20118]|uniref:Mycothiol-dependent maleylpyruvate isomerase metal-binding domain-containing protein n=3 Tax=Cellulomonas cellasea TaxID=43670 RepID=A0A0A0B6Z2_9CELL|nr:hypothetical protein Q760_16310 [Cellulomonas cellasea DSM 20118]GEA86115.1 hypothetical protein CCE01nite_00640 [Cellulomonas cellasea]
MLLENLAAESFAERERLATLLATLDGEQWTAASLCAGWRVREVVAHLTMPYRASPPRFLAGLVRARFSFDRYADQDARRTTLRMTDAELLDLFRANIEHPWQPPGGGPAGALSHDVSHGLDITEPLGLPGPPAHRIAHVLDHARPRHLKYFGVDLRGVRLDASDADVSVGEGTTQIRTMPAKDILLVVTGRVALTEAGAPS